jgi:hypothetical protein
MAIVVNETTKKLRALGGHWAGAKTEFLAGGKVHVTGLTHPDYAEKGLHTTADKLKARLAKDAPAKKKAPSKSGNAIDQYTEYANTRKGEAYEPPKEGTRTSRKTDRAQYAEYAALRQGEKFKPPATGDVHVRTKPQERPGPHHEGAEDEYDRAMKGELSATKPIREAKTPPTVAEANAQAKAKPSQPGEVKKPRARKPKAAS